MIKKANIQWSAKQLSKMYSNGTITFDNAIQRGFCWDNNRKSLLIHSLIENYPVPAFFASKNENGYDMLDGKQRSNAISEYINNQYRLTGIPEVTTEDGETLDINDTSFEELTEEIQDRIKDYSLTIYYFDGIDEEEINNLFFRLNNGKALSSIELIRIKAKSLDIIKSIGSHELFTSTLTASALNKYTNEDLVIKSWAILNTENPSFETKEIRPLVENVDITDEQARQLTQAYTRILDTYKVIKAVEDKEHNKIAKRVITRTHLLSLVPVALQSITDNISIESFVEFVESFFNGKKSATNSETYNSAAGSGSAKAESVKKRLTAITEAYKTFFKPEVKVDTDGKKGNKKAKVTPIRDFDDMLLPKIDDDDWQENFIPNSITDAYNCTMR